MIEGVKKRECDGCRFCCWVYNITDIPDEAIGFEFKSALKHCQHECSKGCSLHGTIHKPSTCVEFKCPYLQDDDIYRPDTFQDLLEELNGNIGNYIPYISPIIPESEVRELIKKTRSIPACITVGDKGLKFILPLDRDKDGSWSSTENNVRKWEELYSKYGEPLSDQIKENINVLMI